MFNRIVFISDLVENHDNASIDSFTLEFTESTYFQDICSALSKIAQEVIHYDSPKLFLDAIHKHKNDIVLSIWSGINSRNRRALVPSICESYNVRYIGADSYTSIVCQDKSLSHQLCKNYNINVPEYLLFENIDDLKAIRELRLPLVIKPNFEGGSIGISRNNLVKNYDTAVNLTSKLLKHFNDCVIAERFIQGDEVSFIIFGNKEKVKMIECIKLELETQEITLRDNLYGLEIKKRGIYKEINTCITDSIDTNLIKKLEKLFLGFSKVEIMRVDGRINNRNEFYCIELSPDIYLGKISSIYKAFEHNGYSYEDMFTCLLQNSQVLY